MPKVNDFWDTKHMLHSNKNHGIYNVRELNLLPESPGLYSWHINSTNINFGSYYKVFKQKKVDINISGHLKELYKGEVKREYYDRDFSSPTIDHNLCEYASSVFCPPLYIGISKNLNKRLKTHFSELEKIYSGITPIPKPTTLGQTQFDTIVESSHFAQRIGFTFVDLKDLRLEDLFIKTIELDSSYSWSELQKVEKYLNRTFVPIYGRK